MDDDNNVIFLNKEAKNEEKGNVLDEETEMAHYMYARYLHDHDEVECDLISIKEACQMLSVGKTFVYKLIEEGVLSAIKLGNRRLITKYSVREYVAECVFQSIIQNKDK